MKTIPESDVAKMKEADQRWADYQREIELRIFGNKTELQAQLQALVKGILRLDFAIASEDDPVVAADCASYGSLAAPIDGDISLEGTATSSEDELSDDDADTESLEDSAISSEDELSDDDADTESLEDSAISSEDELSNDDADTESLEDSAISSEDELSDDDADTESLEDTTISSEDDAPFAEVYLAYISRKSRVLATTGNKTELQNCTITSTKN